jgi:hypothetical protein
MSATSESKLANPEQRIADLERQLAGVRLNLPSAKPSVTRRNGT